MKAISTAPADFPCAQSARRVRGKVWGVRCKGRNMLAGKSTSKEKHILSTAYPPLIHPIKSPLNRRILLDTSDGKTGKLLTEKQANF